jgi:ABC-type multidrug transport system fused ATPase/permease subunit
VLGPNAYFSQVHHFLEYVQRYALVFFPCDKFIEGFYTALFSMVNILPHILAIMDSISISAQLLGDIERVPTIDICRTDGATLWDNEKINAEIELQDVSFSYPSRPDHKSLDGVSMVLEGGKVTALVGGKLDIQRLQANVY